MEMVREAQLTVKSILSNSTSNLSHFHSLLEGSSIGRAGMPIAIDPDVVRGAVPQVCAPRENSSIRDGMKGIGPNDQGATVGDGKGDFG